MTKVFTLSNSKHLEKGITSKIGKLTHRQFADGEIKPRIDESVRGHQAIVFGAMKNESDIIEVLMLVDALNRASAKNIIGVFTYLPYMRQDRKDEPRTPIGAKVIANLLQNTKIEQIVTIDLHASQIEGFFDIPVTHIMGNTLFSNYIKSNFDYSNTIIVSPDLGGGKRAKKLASDLNLPIAIINKERLEANKVSSMELIGNVDGKDVFIVDDMVDTGGSLVKAVDMLLEKGAKTVNACITHGVLSGNAIERINNSNIGKLIITDSINNLDIKSDKIDIITCIELFDDVINTIIDNNSVDEMLVEKY